MAIKKVSGIITLYRRPRDAADMKSFAMNGVGNSADIRTLVGIGYHLWFAP